MMKKTAIYVRVSTKAQDTAAQEHDLSAWAKGQDNAPLWFRDKASGSNMDRVGFRALQDAVNRGEVDSIVVWRLDRLGRTAAGLTALFDDFRKLKVNLISLKDGLDLSTPAGRLMSNVLASVAQYETEVRRERQTAGIAAAKAAGRKWGGSIKGRLLKITPEQASTIRRLRDDKMGISEIARSVGVSRPTVYRLLQTGV
jgi:DNA invertase Pin-like site-specific DNA recombinase